MKIKNIVIALSSLGMVISSCTSGSSSGNSEYYLGQLPDGSKVYINKSSFSFDSSKTANANITIDKITSITKNYKFSFTGSPTVAPKVAQLGCTRRIFSLNCPLQLSIGGANPGNYKITAYYQAPSDNAPVALTNTFSIDITGKALPFGLVFSDDRGFIFHNGAMLSGNKPQSGIDGTAARHIIMDKQGNLYFGSYNGRVWQFSNGTWSVLGNSIANGYLDGSIVRSIAIDNNGVIYAGTENLNVFEYKNNAWTKLAGTAANGALTTQGAVYQLAVDNNGVLYAGIRNFSSTQGYVFKYVNKQWQQLPNISVGSDMGAVRAMSVDKNNNLYVATAYGNIEKYDGISAWSTIISRSTIIAKKGDSRVWDMGFDSNNNLYLATNNGTIFEYLGGTLTQLPGSGTNGKLTNAGLIFLTFNGTKPYSSINSYLFGYAGGTWNQLLNFNAMYGLSYYYPELFSSAGIASDQSGNMYLLTQDYNYQNFGVNVWKYSDGNNTPTRLINNQNYSLDSSLVGNFQVDTHNNIYALTAKGNIFENDGTSWKQIQVSSAMNNSSKNQLVSAIYLDKTNSLYAFTEQYSASIDDYVETTLWKYANNSWSQISGSGTGGAINDGGVIVSNYQQNGTYQTILQDGNNNFYILITGVDNNGNSVNVVNEYSNGKWSQLSGSGTNGNIDDKGYSISNLIINAQGGVYTLDNAKATNHVLQYINNKWTILPGSGTNGNIDNNGQISNLVSDSFGNLYILDATSDANGNSLWLVWKYANNKWSQLPIITNGVITQLIIDSQNNLYALGGDYDINSNFDGSGNNASNTKVWKFVNNQWQLLTANTGLSTTTSGARMVLDGQDNLYVMDGIGNIYQYTGSGTNWTNTNFSKGFAVYSSFTK